MHPGPNSITRRTALTGLASLAATPLLGHPTMRAPSDVSRDRVMVYKRVGCMCCSKWVAHLETEEFEVLATEEPDLDLIKNRLGIPDELRSCHTGLVSGYVVEGHVPADVIRKLLSQKLAVSGLAVPGMPVGSPGMEVEGQNVTPYEIIAFQRDGNSSVFARRG